jgi:release factor glutamine methyltransferase
MRAMNSFPVSEAPITIRQALANGRSHLRPTSPTPELDARLLLQHVLQVGHSYLVAHDDERVTAVQQQQYHACLQRAAQLEPIPYIIGHAPFYGLEFRVSPAVLIPRPETEQLVEMAVRFARPLVAPRIADVGTGSGCIPITLAGHLPQAHIQASDISAEALAIARQNADLLTPGRVAFRLGHLLDPINPPLDLITANLPYVTDGEWTMLDDGVKLHEPALALRGGPDGLDLIRQLLAQASDLLTPGGLLILEIGWQQGPPARDLAQSCFATAVVDIQPDFAGHDRFVVIQT